MRQLKKIRSTVIPQSRVTDLSILSECRTLDIISVERYKTPLGQTVTHVANDISLFRNQQKILKYNPTVVQQVLSEFRAAGTPYSDALKNVSDDDILDTVKSRYIQSVTDVSQYTRQLEEIARTAIVDYAQSLRAKQTPPAQPASASSVSE